MESAHSVHSLQAASSDYSVQQWFGFTVAAAVVATLVTFEVAEN